MSGADPWVGSNIDGTDRSGLMFPLDARPMLPEIMAPMSVIMSPNRFDATMTSKASGRRTSSMHAASTSSE